jgi:uncharacterized protein YpuA (DUF1002 family)
MSSEVCGLGFQSYQSYGIERAWVERLKKRAKDPVRKEKLKDLADGLTKEDLQDPETVEKLVVQAFKVLGEKPTVQQSQQLVSFVLDQQIDPKNMFHLLKLWSMFH